MTKEIGYFHRRKISNNSIFTLWWTWAWAIPLI